MSVESIRALIKEYDSIQKKIYSIKSTSLIKNCESKLNVITFVDNISKKPSAAYATAFLNKISNFNDPVLNEIRMKVEIQIDYVEDTKNKILDYRLNKKEFVELLNWAKKRKSRSDLFQFIKKDWIKTRKLIHDISLYDLELTKQYLSTECLFIALKFFHLKPCKKYYQKSKIVVTKLNDKWKILKNLKKENQAFTLLNDYLKLDSNSIPIYSNDVSYLAPLERPNNFRSNLKSNLLSKRVKRDNFRSELKKPNSILRKNKHKANVDKQKKEEIHPIAARLGKLNQNGNTIRYSSPKLEVKKEDTTISSTVKAEDTPCTDNSDFFEQLISNTKIEPKVKKINN